jgi:hypothetical protein
MSDRRLAKIEAAILALDEVWMGGPLDEGSFVERYGKSLAQVEAMDTLIVIHRSFRPCPDG